MSDEILGYVCNIQTIKNDNQGQADNQGRYSQHGAP
ncbi:Uncharacterised protein [Chlamydia abortus]|nr:Uncharacterised protein [Chlamydia abortus]